MQRSERMQHMGEEERLLLLDLMTERRAILLNRATDARIIPVKARTWEEVTNSLAASGLGPPRTVKQVKKIWENMRSRAKKFVSDQKKNLCRTGGGPQSPVTKPDPVLEKILALIADELEPDPNHNDSDSWPTDVTVVCLNEMGEQVDEPMAMTEQPSTACTVPVSLMPAGGNDSAPPACTSFVESSGTTALFYSPAIHSTTSVEAPATVASICSTPLPSTSVLASVPVTSPSELPPIQSSSARGKMSGKKFKAKKRKVEDSVTRESYEMLSKFQKEEHEIVIQIHKQNLENKKMEGDYLRQKMQMMSSLHSQAKEHSRQAAACPGTMTAAPDVADKAPPSCGQQAPACPDKMAAAPGVVKEVLPFCGACQGLQRQEDGDVELPVYVWNFAAAHGLVHRALQCPWCQCPTTLYRHSRFRCQRMMTTFVDHRLVTKRCNFDVSALKGTFFDHSNLPMKKILCLCYWFVVDTATYNEVMGKVNVPLYRLIYWYTLCQELIITYCLNHCSKIGGPGKTVKVTEARLREKKYCRPSTKGQWVLGGFEEESRSFFLISIPDRRKETLEQCIREWILPGTEIISDFWGKCASLSFEGCVQKTVHHPKTNGIPESSAAPENADQQPQGSRQSAEINTWAQEPFVGQLTLSYFKLTFPDVLQRFHQLLVLAAQLYPPQKEECLAQPHVSQEPLPNANKKRRNGESLGPVCTNHGQPPVLGNRKPAGEGRAAQASIRCERITLTKVEDMREPRQIEIMITDDKEVTPSAAEDPLALSPHQQPAWEEDATQAQYLQHGMSGYVQSLPVDQRKQYLSKLRLKKYNMYLPDPYILGGWESAVRLWPDLNIGHIHQHLSCGQAWAAEKKDVGTMVAVGYNTFKLGHVLAVESSRVQSDIPVCFVKARVTPLRATVAENCDVWVCLEETGGTILASHCTCLFGLTEVCRHVVALLFRVEAATSLGMTCKGLDSDNSRLAVWDRHHRPKNCVACVKDIDFIHPSSSRRLKASSQIQPVPLSHSEQMQALAELKEILPNAPLFMRRDSDTDAALLFGKSHQPDPALCQGLAAWETPVGIEDTHMSVKIEADEAPCRTDTPQMPRSLSWSSEEPRTAAACFEEPELSVKVEDEIFVKMEEIEDDSYLIESW